MGEKREEVGEGGDDGDGEGKRRRGEEERGRQRGVLMHQIFMHLQLHTCMSP